MKKLIVIFGVVWLSGCAQFLIYCDEKEARAALRAIGPVDWVDAGVIGACASAQAFSNDRGDEMSNKAQKAQQRIEVNKAQPVGDSPFVEGTKKLKAGWRYGRGSEKGQIINVKTGEVWHG